MIRMKGKTGAWRGRAFIGALLFLLLLGTAGAAQCAGITACCPARGEMTVVARETEKTCVLSLPGCWDAEEILLSAEGTGKLYLGKEKQEILPSEPVDLTGWIGRTVPLWTESGKRLPDLTILRGSSLPALFLEVDPTRLGKINRDKTLSITEGRAVYLEADGSVGYAGGLTQLKGRGNNTFAYAKKPYQLKLEKKVSLSGMSRGKTWVLLANWNDLSLLRNQVVLDLAREAGLRCAVGCRQVDVWINGIYQGLYLMTEKIQINKNRLNLTDLEEATRQVNDQPPESCRRYLEKGGKILELARGYQIPNNPEDITGGYLASIEKFARLRDYPVPGFRLKNTGISVRVEEPTCPSREQVEYLGARMDEALTALTAPDGRHPETGKSYYEYLDSTSFALKLLIEDFCKNYDMLGGSQLIYKDSDRVDPLIYAGPAWDYDLSFGMMKDRGAQPTGEYVLSANFTKRNLYQLFWNQEDFRRETREIWQRSFRPALGVLLGETEGEGVLRSLTAYAEEIRASAVMNAKRWGTNSGAGRLAGSNFETAVAYLENWIRQRVSWMEEKSQYSTAQKTAQKQEECKKGVDNHPSEDYHYRNDSASAGGRILTDDDDAGGYLLF